ncbi:MAG: hypothetical protein ACYC96_03975 [Fimbriimonadaceae bacterium]
MADLHLARRRITAIGAGFVICAVAALVRRFVLYRGIEASTRIGLFWVSFGLLWLIAIVLAARGSER